MFSWSKKQKKILVKYNNKKKDVQIKQNIKNEIRET